MGSLIRFFPSTFIWHTNDVICVMCVIYSNVSVLHTNDSDNNSSSNNNNTCSNKGRMKEEAKPVKKTKYLKGDTMRTVNPTRHDHYWYSTVRQ